jgi:hypothetical protein
LPDFSVQKMVAPAAAKKLVKKVYVGDLVCIVQIMVNIDGHTESQSDL